MIYTWDNAKFKLSPLIFGLSVLTDYFIENTDHKGLADGLMEVGALALNLVTQLLW